MHIHVQCNIDNDNRELSAPFSSTIAIWLASPTALAYAEVVPHEGVQDLPTALPRELDTAAATEDENTKNYSG